MGPVDLASNAITVSLLPAVEDMIARATAWQASTDGRTTLLDALQRLFKAYDISESGKVSCSDYVKLEIRNGLDQGDPRRILQAFPKMLRADSSGSGMLNFLEFCATRLTSSDGASRKIPSIPELLGAAKRDLASTLSERWRMGAYYCVEIRHELREVFASWKADGAVCLSPCDWVLAARLVEAECDNILSAKWTGEASFAEADRDRDGLLDLEEFTWFSCNVLEDFFEQDLSAALEMLRKVRSHPDTRTPTLTVKIAVYMPQAFGAFQLPTQAQHLESAYRHALDLELPSSITRLSDFLKVLRLKLGLIRMWFAVFWQSAGRGMEKRLDLLSPENGTKLLHDMFDVAAKKTGFSAPAIYVSNVRPRAFQLQDVPCQELELNSLRIQTGTRWCLDWELQLLGSSRSRFIKCPRDLRIALGDSLVISLPPEALGISCKIYTGDGGAVSKPSLEQVQVQKGKRGKKVIQALAGAVPENAGGNELVPQPPTAPKPTKKRPQSGVSQRVARLPVDRRLVFVAQREGTCTLFVELSWEHQEELLAQGMFPTPAAEASVGRIGPLQITVQKTAPPVPEMQKSKGVLWWTGSKWAAKQMKSKPQPESRAKTPGDSPSPSSWARAPPKRS